jgi:hypothetical protein
MATDAFEQQLARTWLGHRSLRSLSDGSAGAGLLLVGRIPLRLLLIHARTLPHSSRAAA